MYHLGEKYVFQLKITISDFEPNGKFGRKNAFRGAFLSRFTFLTKKHHFSDKITILGQNVPFWRHLSLWVKLHHFREIC